MDCARPEEAQVTGGGPSVVVFDYGSGNVRSVVRAFEAAGARVSLTGDLDAALEADGLVVPGVGAFDATMTQLTAARGPYVIDQRLAGGKPVLGICVGLQVMFDSGTELGVSSEGLGQWPGSVERLRSRIVPHMGWNTVEVPEHSRLFAGVEGERFYFVHSYAARDWVFEPTSSAMVPPLVTWAEHDGDRFIAAVENGALMATQFHPEKSGEAGSRLIRNWLDTLPRRADGERNHA